MSNFLQIKWDSAHEHLGMRKRFSEYYRLVVCYSQPHRHYHTLTHLKHALSIVAHCPEITLALFYHDSVYDLQSSDKNNVLASSQRWIEYSSLMQFPEKVVREVDDLILVTDHRDYGYLSENMKLIRDIDNSILASYQATYEEYAINIFKEYSQVYSVEQYVDGRAKFLESVLRKKSIFHNREFDENRARDNIRRELEVLNEVTKTGTINLRSLHQ